MSSTTPRKERRMKWMAERIKSGMSRATKREGLRPNPSAVNPFVITSENKGGFKPSNHAQKVLSSSSNISAHKTISKLGDQKDTSNENHSGKPKTKNNSKNSVKVKNDKDDKKDESDSKKSENTQQENKTSETKYVLFIGNLPYSVTKENLEEHFRKTGGVKKIRIPQDKAKQCSRGFAYIEFKDRISHGIALRLHHTTLGGRKINVEFTSIGGKNEQRKDKLKKKNEALAKFKMPLGS